MRSRVSKTRVYFPPIEVTGKVTLNFCTMGINGFVASKSDELTSRLVVCSMHSRFMVSWNTRKNLQRKTKTAYKCAAGCAEMIVLSGCYFKKSLRHFTKV